jgi:outer membrane protein TolC
MVITAIFMYGYAGAGSDSIVVGNDSAIVMHPDARRIATDRIKMIQSFTDQETDELGCTSGIKLTLDDAIRCLITNNKDIKKAKLQYLIGEKQYRATFGAFEPYLAGNYDYSESGRPDAYLIELRESLKYAVEGVLPTATRYNFTLTQKDIRLPQSTLEWPTVSSSVGIVQPLLKNFIWDNPIADIKIAKAEHFIAFNRYRSTLIEQCYSLETAYWKLVYLQEKRRNAIKSVSIARQIVEDSRTLVASGIISKLDAVEISSQLAQRQMALSTVKIEHVGVMNELMQMLGFPPDSALLEPSAVTPLTIDSMADIPDSLPALVIDSLISINQPELLAAGFTTARSKVAVSQLKGKALPELNLTGSFGVFGASRNYNQAAEQFLDRERNKQNWGCGVELKVPLGTGIRDRNLLKAEKLNQKIVEVEENFLRNELTTQSMLTVGRIRNLTENLSNAAVVIEYRTTLLKSEIVRLRAGLSNVRKIFEMEQDLANARESELEMRVQYKMAHSLYDRLLGVTLSKRGLETVTAGKPQLSKILTQE